MKSDKLQPPSLQKEVRLMTTFEEYALMIMAGQLIIDTASLLLEIYKATRH